MSQRNIEVFPYFAVSFYALTLSISQVSVSAYAPYDYSTKVSITRVSPIEQLFRFKESDLWHARQKLEYEWWCYSIDVKDYANFSFLIPDDKWVQYPILHMQCSV